MKKLILISLISPLLLCAKEKDQKQWGAWYGVCGKCCGHMGWHVSPYHQGLEEEVGPYTDFVVISQKEYKKLIENSDSLVILK